MRVLNCDGGGGGGNGGAGPGTGPVGGREAERWSVQSYNLGTKESSDAQPLERTLTLAMKTAAAIEHTERRAPADEHKVMAAAAAVEVVAVVEAV